MTEKEKMKSQKLYDANYDHELEKERLECKALCQEYNHLPIKDLEKRRQLIKRILGKTGEHIHIEPDFWCDYGYLISAGENFYANHGLVVLDAGGVSFGDNVLLQTVVFILQDILSILREEIRDWSMRIQSKSEITYGLARVYR